MVIQCTSCQTKYRLNLERIPNRKTFVKCRSCGTPIYIEPPADAEPEPPRVAPAAAAPEPPQAPLAEPSNEPPVVTCPNCETRYRLPPEALHRPNAKMKCSRCGHVFAPGAAAALPHGGAASEKRGFHAPSGMDERAPGSGLERPMPIPDDTAVDGMFDDFRERATPFAAGAARGSSSAKAMPAAASPEPPEPDFSGLEDTGPEGELDESPDSAFEQKIRSEIGEDLSAQLGFHGMSAAEQEAAAEEPEAMPEPERSATLFTTDLEQLGEQAAEAASRSLHPAREADPERAYLEAVAMDQDLPLRPKPRGTVPDDQKYRFFLKPGLEPPPIKAPTSAPRAGGAKAAPARPPQIIPPAPPSPSVRSPGPPPPLERFPAELEEMDTAFEPAIPGEEESFPPPPGEPARGFEAELEAADLDVMTAELEEDAELSEGLDVSDDVDLLLQQHGVAADAMDGEDVSIVRTDPLAPLGGIADAADEAFGETAPAPRAPAGRSLTASHPLGRAPLSEQLLRSLGRSMDMATGGTSPRSAWVGQALTAGAILAALAVIVFAFWLGYRLG